jgi:hypothetical protein
MPKVAVVLVDHRRRGSLSEILCVMHTMTIRSMYAKQEEAEECSHCREIGGAAEDSPGVA